MIPGSMLIKKDVWDLIKTSPCLKYQNPGLFTKEVREDWMAVGRAWWIIQKDDNDQIAFNIIDLKDGKEIWDKFKSICNVIKQSVIYLILQELFNYLKINKPKGYNKPKEYDNIL